MAKSEHHRWRSASHRLALFSLFLSCSSVGSLSAEQRDIISSSSSSSSSSPPPTVVETSGTTDDASEPGRRRRRRRAKKNEKKAAGDDAEDGEKGERDGDGEDGEGDLLVCRNLRLDEVIFKAPSLPGPAPYRSRFVTEEIIIGGGGGENDSSKSSDDTDVTFLLADRLGVGGGGGGGSGAKDRFDASVHFRLRFATNYPRDVKLLMVDYTSVGAKKGAGAGGVRIGSAPGPALQFRNYTIDANDCFVAGGGDGNGGSEGGGCFADAVLSIPSNSYVNPSSAPWSSMRRIAIAYGLPEGGDSTSGAALQDVEVRLQRIQLCSSQRSPHFCSEPSLAEYRIGGHDCKCKTCHRCGCSAAPPWAADCDGVNGVCGSDQGGCWCGIACKCCSDCPGYQCNCQTCFDGTSLKGCAVGSTFAAESVEPSDGIGSSTNEIVVKGRGFFENASNVTCRFSPLLSDDSAAEFPGGYRSPTEIFCSVPPVTFANKETPSLIASVSVSLDGRTFSEPNPSATFTYYNCPNGCGGGGGGDDGSGGDGGAASSCPASACACPPDRYGPDCSEVCTDCVHGRCGAVTGRCACEDGWTGTKCDLRCPTSGTGSDGGGKEGEEDNGQPCSRRGTCYASTSTSDGGGTVEEATCYCPPEYWGPACENDCPRNGNGHVCGNRGSCGKRDGRCLCDEGYYGDACEGKCPGLDHDNDGGGGGGGGGGIACSGHGICCTGQGVAASYSQCRGTGGTDSPPPPLGSCACDAGRVGRACEDVTCFEDCYGHGMCDQNGTCVCSAGYDGTFCSLQKGQDASLSYVSFADSAYTVTEEQGSVDVSVIRSGNLTEAVSVRFATRDLTASAGEDYAALDGRLSWSSMDGAPKTIAVSVMSNDWPEGQESFELVLSDPVPPSRCSVSGTGRAVIRIAAKAESSSDTNPSGGRKKVSPRIAARITIRVSKPYDTVQPGEVAGEEMRAALRDAVSTALSINSNRIYLQGGSGDVKPTEFGRVLVTFDILPPLAGGESSSAAGAKNAREAADDFVKAAADQSSALYRGRDMDRLCPIDTSFMPEVRLFALDGGDVDGSGKSGGRSAFVVVLLFLVLAALAAASYRKRECIMEGLLRWLSHRKFQRIRGTADHVVEYDNEYSEPGISGLSEYAVARCESGGLQEGLKRKVLQIELT